MTLLRSIVLSIAGVAISVFALVSIQNLFQIPLTSETESKFFRSYDPLAVVNSLSMGCYPDGTPTGMPTAVGTGESHSSGSSFPWALKDAEHHREVQPRYCANSTQNAVLVAALRENLVATLRSSRCSMWDELWSSETGLRIRYRCGEHSLGIVTVVPPKVETPDNPIHQGLSVRVDERWSPRA